MAAVKRGHCSGDDFYQVFGERMEEIKCDKHIRTSNVVMVELQGSKWDWSYNFHSFKDDYKRFVKRYKKIIKEASKRICTSCIVSNGTVIGTKSIVLYVAIFKNIKNDKLKDIGIECNNKKLYYKYDDVLQCVICMNEYKSYMVTPCNHICLCKKCSTDVKKCPICRSDIVSIVKVFI